MNILLDTLAYNTHYLGYNANMLANEMFLDSSSLRSSAVSHAKMLGYEVSSARAAKATISIGVTTTSSSLTMDAGTVFTAKVDDIDYQFVLTKDISAVNVGNSVIFYDVDIYEGTYVTTKYVVDTSNPDQRFLLVDPRSDTATLTVKIQNSSSDTTTTTFTKATDITQLTTTSDVYFLQEVESGKFEVYFGDGVVSKALSDSNIVILQYVVTNKSAANGAASFTAPSAIDGETDIRIVVNSIASGGAERESISSIKLNAPLNYAAQGRAVTTDDYKVYVKKLFPNTQSVSVWGGEDGSYDVVTGLTSSVPEYGKVFISVKTTTGQNMTSTQKLQLETDLKPYKVASITPVVIDPITTSLILGITFQYNSNITTKSNEALESLVSTTVSNYNTSSLKTFNSIFRYSEFIGLIDDTESSVLSNITTVTMAQYLTPVTTSSNSYTIDFSNAFYHPHSGHNESTGGIIASTGFNINDKVQDYYFDEDGNGNLRIYYLLSGEKTYHDKTAGTVDYDNGKIIIDSVFISSVLDVDGASSTRIRITAIPSSNDIVPVRNQVLEIDEVNTVIKGTVDQISTSGVGYTTTTTAGISTTTVSTTSSTPTRSAY
ncbi:uncharacterized protein METZ01_LOCUS56334 [marine metagenome]|uniref:Baseplate protein J-like domain-containing protein n=1 Tax=marine metagenome TaxID=408172 RepID=A0A381SHF0_9ZZZZ